LKGFEKFMKKILHEILCKIYLIYLNGVIIFSKTFEGILVNLQEVWQAKKISQIYNNKNKILKS